MEIRPATRNAGLQPYIGSVLTKMGGVDVRDDITAHKFRFLPGTVTVTVQDPAKIGAPDAAQSKEPPASALVQSASVAAENSKDNMLTIEDVESLRERLIKEKDIHLIYTRGGVPERVKLANIETHGSDVVNEDTSMGITRSNGEFTETIRQRLRFEREPEVTERRFVLVPQSERIGRAQRRLTDEEYQEEGEMKTPEEDTETRSSRCFSGCCWPRKRKTQTGAAQPPEQPASAFVQSESVAPEPAAREQQPEVTERRFVLVPQSERIGRAQRHLADEEYQTMAEVRAQFSEAESPAFLFEQFSEALLGCRTQDEATRLWAEFEAKFQPGGRVRANEFGLPKEYFRLAKVLYRKALQYFNLIRDIKEKQYEKAVEKYMTRTFSSRGEEDFWSDLSTDLSEAFGKETFDLLNRQLDFKGYAHRFKEHAKTGSHGTFPLYRDLLVSFSQINLELIRAAKRMQDKLVDVRMKVIDLFEPLAREQIVSTFWKIRLIPFSTRKS